MSETRDAVRAVQASLDVFDSAGAWSEKDGLLLLDRLLADGWNRVGLAEEFGGSGGGLIDALDVAAGSVGSPSPLADVVAVASQLIGWCGLGLPDDAGVVVLAAATDGVLGHGALSAVAPRVPWASWSTHLLVPVADRDGTAVALVAAADGSITAGANLAGEPRDAVTLRDVRPVAVARLDAPLAAVLDRCEHWGALARSAQIAAALAAALQLTLEHTRQRVQFGKQLSSFQAVQQQLAELAGEAAAAQAITDLAATAAADGGADRSSEAGRLVACAKVRCGMAAGAGARIAHQLHGAIGISQEHPLHRYTRALWSWRDEYGGETVWARRIAAQLVAADAPGLWEWSAGA